MKVVSPLFSNKPIDNKLVLHILPLIHSPSVFQVFGKNNSVDIYNNVRFTDCR